MSTQHSNFRIPENEGETANQALATRVAGLQAQVAQQLEMIKKLEIRISGYERAFYENPVPAIVYDLQELAVIDANSSVLALYGYEKDRFCSLTLSDLFAPGANGGAFDLFKEFRKPVNAIGPFSHRNSWGQEIIVSIVLFPFEMGGRDARIAMVQDETGRHNAEEALRASEERFRELFENANDVIFMHDLKGKIIAVNRAAEYLTGYSRAEVIGKSFEDLIAPEARHQTKESIQAHLGGSASQHYELPILSKFATRRFLEVSTRIIYRRGYPIAIQGIGRDVTERKLAQQRLLESTRELQAKNEELSTALRLATEATQLKEQFLANTSHELRTPMNGIMGMATLLKNTELTADQREYADAVSQCANDLLTIINDILDVSQIEAGRLSVRNEIFDLPESVNSVLKMLRLRAVGKGLTLTSEIAFDVPRLLCCDCVRFRQILTNLVANAVKFTAEGGVHVRFHLAEHQEFVRCEVIDSGIGVDKSVQDRIFEAFFQADGTTRRRYGGTGLGLTISKQLVEIMGGRIGITHNPAGTGSVFWFELPKGNTNNGIAQPPPESWSASI